MMDDRRKQDAPAAAGAQDDEPGFDLGAPPNLGAAPKAASAANSPYRVLARKYRPSSFDDLIGQEAMVRTLTNAFALNRIHQAYLLTGVRGVGKTTTARILARAFNYERPAHDGQPAIDQPSVEMKELGVHCQAIIESRHVDVIEMDAASHTGVDDVREIIEGARYRPVMARCKVYIIDEVHMLSKSAFNALLKTLEEPPDNVRFLFATTEIEKVPVTVRSRCQRFDLRRIEADVLIDHLAGICEKENVAIEREALALVVRAAEGSVRDALSLLDQAIAHGENAGESAGETASVTAASIRTMLGAGDRSRIIDIFEAVMKGEIAPALGVLRELYDQGADPLLMLTDLAEFVHFVTRQKLAPSAQFDASVTQDESQRGSDFAKSLSLATLTRAWQIISKGLGDVKDSPRPMAAADMVLVRLAYAADLPSPEDALRRLAALASDDSGVSGAGHSGASGSGTVASGASHGVPAMRGGGPVLASTRSAPMAALQQAQPAAKQNETAQPRVQIKTFEDIVTLARTHRDIQLRTALERDVRLVRFERGQLEFSLADGASPQLAATLMRRLQEWSGERWIVAISSQEGEPTIHERQQARDRETMSGVRATPLVRSVLEAFPGAEIVAVRMPEAEPAPGVVVAAADDNGSQSEDVVYADQVPDEDDDD